MLYIELWFEGKMRVNTKISISPNLEGSKIVKWTMQYTNRFEYLHSKIKALDEILMRLVNFEIHFRIIHILTYSGSILMRKCIYFTVIINKQVMYTDDIVYIKSKRYMYITKKNVSSKESIKLYHFTYSAWHH